MNDPDEFGAPVPEAVTAWRRWVRGDSRALIASDLEVTPDELDAMLAEQAVASERRGTVSEQLAAVADLLDLITVHATNLLDQGHAYADPGPVLATLATVANTRLRILHGTTDTEKGTTHG